mmetsp:Transcript_17292/g.16951  ORF Transcript_17292/g.16951 Transcript_17292/m.16951 type:complete len:376 (-) Transcript_17292:121-1248(-)|eukprot:CAMPEP_0197015648 /NCGR_PEP_ID=MMETSP1380-20130617/75065_1 /TAXON_ID=5936 /ORGANISM="Euplotes crassus, Strain CT5" /LENGTH=375 /DNA_ID=CAMNT_0042441721 /DNA_START=190 /DNA_END=1317 /DNA_ORIENTATION=+
MRDNKYKPFRIRIWKVSDKHNLQPPSDYQYMNPVSYGRAVTDADSSFSYSSSENWYKKRSKYSKSSNRSSARGNSAQQEKSDDNFINELLCKNEDVENRSSNVSSEGQNSLAFWGNKRIEQSLSKFSSHLQLPSNVEEVPEPNSLVSFEPEDVVLGGRGSDQLHKQKGKKTDPEDEDFVEEIIEDEDDNKSIEVVDEVEEEDDVVDEVGEVEVPTMGETGHKFNEIILSDDEFDSVVIDPKKEKSMPPKASLFQDKAAKFTSSYEYKNKTVAQSKRKTMKETIEDDEIKEEINVEDDSEDEAPATKLRKKFLDRIANNRTIGKGRSNTMMKLKGSSPLRQFLDSKGDSKTRLRKDNLIKPPKHRLSKNTRMIELE